MKLPLSLLHAIISYRDKIFVFMLLISEGRAGELWGAAMKGVLSPVLE
jgi:hypothetical protein